MYTFTGQYISHYINYCCQSGRSAGRICEVELSRATGITLIFNGSDVLYVSSRMTGFRKSHKFTRFLPLLHIKFATVEVVVVVVVTATPEVHSCTGLHTHARTHARSMPTIRSRSGTLPLQPTNQRRDR